MILYCLPYRGSMNITHLGGHHSPLRRMVFFHFLLVNMDVVSLATYRTSPGLWLLVLGSVYHDQFPTNPRKLFRSIRISGLLTLQVATSSGGFLWKKQQGSFNATARMQAFQGTFWWDLGGQFYVDWLGWRHMLATLLCVEDLDIWRSPPGMYKTMCITGYWLLSTG